MLLWLRNSFLTGIVVSAPIGATLWLVWSFLRWVDGRVVPLIPAEYNPENYLPVAIPGLGLIISVVALTFLGAITANIFGRSLIGMGERIVERVPLVSSIYGTVKQIVQTVLSQQEQSFDKVVLIEYPRKGTYAVGFVSAPAQGEIAASLGEDVVGVFIPTAPNPTSGFLIYEKKKNLTYLDMPVDAGAKLILSAGLVYPNGAGRQPDESKRTA
ncbi:MAG: hypothetical protein COA84_00845 [Robiginitomaculum sp.]|nr:MAG: hypothetical protein COA84_00845 [Robiginitomaculum sp.]